MVLNGDGIGPEVMDSALDVIGIMRNNFGVNIEPVLYDIGVKTVAEAKWELESVLEEARKYKAILKAPMGNPTVRNQSGTEPGLDIILGLRFELDLFANVRPIKLLPGVKSVLGRYSEPDSIDYTILRENSEGLYASHFGGLILRDEIAIDNQTITRKGTERISHLAFKLSKESLGSPKLRKRIVTCVDKSNVLKTFAFFRKVFAEVSRKYPDVVSQYMYADAMTQYMIFHPEELNIVVTENMFGDILSDLGAATVGGLGIAYSANLSETQGMFEPVHGSAVDIAGKGVANPIAMIMSLHMLMDWLGFKRESGLLENSVRNVLISGIVTPDMGGTHTTNDVTKQIIRDVRRH